MLVKKYHDTHCEDKEVLITIKKAIDASPELRSKKQLIETFIPESCVDDVMNEWNGSLLSSVRMTCRTHSRRKAET
jgi:type I restriction enzyme R subunit